MTSSHLSGSESETIRATSWKQVLKWSIRLIVLLLVGWGILQTGQDASEKLTSHQFRILDLRPLWLLASAAFYFLAMLPMAAFWHRVLWSMDQRPIWSETFSAHCTGQLGKYVPGKAMVVFLRATLIRSDRVDVVAAGIGVFVETLSVMAIGACVAAGILAFQYSGSDLAMVVLAVCLALAAGIPVFPPMMKRIIWFLRLKKLGLTADSLLAGFTLKRLAPGWIGLVVSWWLIGLSLWAAIAAMPQGPTPIESIGDWPLLTACAALAMVAGFLSLLPAGILVREYVVMALLAPEYGPLVAIVSAVVLRLTWLLTELITAAVCYGHLRFRRFPRQER